MQEKSLRLRIGDMRCAHCETTIREGLLAMPGVRQAKVSFGRGTAELVYDAESTTKDALEAAVQQLGYTVLENPPRPVANHLRAAGLLLVIAALFLALQATGALNALAPGQLAQAGMGFGMLFVIGLFTSVHCVAMCGGITLSQCITVGNAGRGKAAALKPSLLYNLGRVVAYTATGFAVGALGSTVTFSPALQGMLKLLAGVCMVVMGIHMLGIFPWIRQLTIRLPRFITDRIRPGKWTSGRPLAVGLLNGFMPCGPLQAIQLYALSTGSPVTGAMSMLLFSLGTVPLMFGLGALSTLLSRKFTHRMLTTGAVLVAVLGLSMLSQGWALAKAPVSAATLMSDAAGTANDAPQAGAGESPHTAAGDVQQISSTLSSNRYPDITVQAGTPVQWTIYAPAGSINGCNNHMYIPAYGIDFTFTQGDNLISFTPTQTGTFPYSCWMGMIRASITVVASKEALPATGADATAGDPSAGVAATETPKPLPNTIPTAKSTSLSRG